MPAKKKTTTAAATVAKKAPIQKVEVKKVPEAAAKPAPAAAAKPAPAPKKAPAKKTPVKKAAPVVDQKPKAVLTPEERYQRVQTEAYYLAEREGFGGDPQAYWAAAEAKVASELA